MDVSHSRQHQEHHHLPPLQQHGVCWPTHWTHDWMHRHPRQLHLNNPFPPPLFVPTEPKRALSSCSSSSTSLGGSRGGAAAPTFFSSAMKSNVTRSSSAPKASSGQLASYASRRHCSPCRKLQQCSPQLRRSCQPGPTPSPDLLLADKAEWKRTLHDTTYRTYKALPRSNRPFDLKDYVLLREILALAENLMQPEGAEVRLMDVLKAYDMVLQKHAMDPAEDTFYYRMLLKLSLSSTKDWWKRLNQEIVKNDLLLKVNSFRNHKLLLSYWLLWRCHHEKGVPQEKGKKKLNILEGENVKSCNGIASKEENQHVVTPTVQQPKMKDAGDNQNSVPFYMGDLPLEDTVLVMDIVEVPVWASKSLRDFDIKGSAPVFQAWQRIVRQRKKKRLTRERNAQQCLLQKTCFTLWRRHSHLMRELCKAGNLFHEKKLCVLILMAWRKYLLSLKELCKDLCKGRALWGWRKSTGFRKHATQAIDHRLCFTRKRYLMQWRSRLQNAKKHKDALYHCRKYHQIHVVSSCFQGWQGVCYHRTRCRRQIAIHQHRCQKAVLKNWHARIQFKSSLKQVLLMGLSWRAGYLQRLSLSIWLSWWKIKKIMERKKIDVFLHQKKRILFQALSAWRTQGSRRRYMKDWLARALKLYALQLCKRSVCGWRHWQTKCENKNKRFMTIMKLICSRRCIKVLEQWKELADSKKQEEKHSQRVRSYYRTRRKVKYWHLWYQNSGYQAAITQRCALRNHKMAVLILRALRGLAKSSTKRGQLARRPCEHKDQRLSQDFEANGCIPIFDEGGLTQNLIQSSRKNRMKSLLLTSKEFIRKWKHFVEVKRTNGTNKTVVVKYWAKFWLKTALEGWRIVLQKKKLADKLPQQLVTEDKNTCFLMKLKLLKDRTAGNELPTHKGVLWRRLTLEKLSLQTWIRLKAIRQEQAKTEFLYVLQLKRWWISTILSHWRAVAKNSLQEEGKLYQTGHFVSEQDKNILTDEEITAFSTSSSELEWASLPADTSLDEDKFKLYFSAFRNYTYQLKAAKALKIVRKSTIFRYLWQQWKQATVKALEERTELAVIIGHLSTSPGKHKIMLSLLEECPRWNLHKGFQSWKAWKVGQPAKRVQNRRALEHLAGVLQAKALASFHAAMTAARTLRMSVKHFNLCCQVKSILAWRTYTTEHLVKKTSKNSAVAHYRHRTEMIVLKKWSLYSHMSQRADYVKSRAEDYWRVSTLQKCLKAWIEMFLKFQAKHQYLLWIKIRMDLHCLHNVLCAWRYSSQRKINQQNHIDYMKEHRRMVCLYQRFHVWIGYIHRKKCVRAAQEMHRRRHLKAFFQSWVYKIVRLKCKKEAKETVKDHVINKFCRTAFLIWRDLTVMARHARNTQWLAASKIRQYRMTWTFSRWKDVVKTLNFKREVEHTADLRKKHKFFCTWAEVVKMQGRWTECQVSVMCMRQKRWVRFLFQIWLQRSCDLKREREGNIKALMFARNCLLLRVFKRFMGWMHGRQMKEGFTLLACGKLQHVYLKRAFDAWLRQVEIHVRKQAAHDQLQRVWDHCLLAKSFNGLQEVITENWRLKGCVIKALQYNVMGTKLHKVVCLQQHHFCHSLLQHWRKRTFSCNVSRHNEQRFKVKTLERAFHEWKSFAQNKMHLDVLARKLSTLHCTVLGKQCWLHWQFRTEKAQYQQQFRLFKTFRTWVKYIKVKAFKRCMQRDAIFMILQSLQKRVLWGWQSLVREISIRREEHQQQRFLQREAMVLANRTERRQKIESLSTIFKAWQARFQQAVNISMFIDRQKFQVKKSIWLSWMSWVNLEGCARRVRHQWIRMILQSSLNVWRKTCTLRISQFREKEAEAAHFASCKLKQLVWPQWKTYVSSCKERVKALQDCLALIQTGQDSDLVRGIIHAWKDYTLERGKRREHSWAAEASYKRHKLADYLNAWHDYTAAAKESASSLKGTIQVYQGSNCHFRAMADSMYRFRRGIGHVSSYMADSPSFRDIGVPTIVIEEVSSPVEEREGAVLSHPAQWAMPPALLETEGSPLARLMSNNGSIHSQSQLLRNGPQWSSGRSIKYLGLEIEDDIDDWSLKDVDIDAS
ncbi:hypothetical protein GOP47_0023550 [Adiantum capillus-veneris]|uniref:Uncharacterized protein n=1 Tax=Adiantum capillus-veneris TaxID=13818 RepID=A0A9D4Z4M7_ADICA|nr:hypothetical protein GOP47_0023550 [Adiantum capillus-veneris]